MYKLTIFLGLAVLVNANQHRTYENPSCPDDKVWDQCGDPCPVTCEDVKNNTTIKPCPKICLEAACVCETGKAIDNNGQCVTFQTCLAKSYQYHQSENVLDCREGEIFNECGDACEVTCDDVDNNRLPKPCPLICGRPACVCVDDKARNHRGDCVTYRQCMLKKTLSLQDIIEPNGQDRNENTENRRERNQNRQEWRDRDENQRCGRNEEFKECGTTCPKTCLNKHILNPWCTNDCAVNVCQCKEGYVRNLEGLCVEPEACPNRWNLQESNSEEEQNERRCGENEILKECGTRCEKTCRNYFHDIGCIQECVPNVCQCQQGYVRDDSNKCVAISQCPRIHTDSRQQNNRQCPANEEFKECGTSCEKTCGDRDPEFCTQVCIENVCQCKDGFVRNPEGHCVEPETCPQRWNLQESNSEHEQSERRCGENEIWKQCGTRCEKTCRNYFRQILCTQECVPNVCQCQQGYVRNDSNKCVAKSQCPPINTEPQKQCNINEEFNVCGTACEKTCRNPKPKFCPEICVMNVCQCKDGFVRNQSGICIRLEQCPQIDGDDQNERECGTNEIWTECGTACEKTCRNFFIEIPCTKQCIPNVCRCKPGHVRYNRNRCVAQTQCHRTNTEEEQNERECGANEIRTECGTACEKTCRNFFVEIPCTLECVPNVCQCKPGHVRNDWNICVAQSRCPRINTDNTQQENERSNVDREDQNAGATHCWHNEYFSSCGRSCEKTCETWKDKHCTLECQPEGCTCKRGYVRENERCVPVTQCRDFAGVVERYRKPHTHRAHQRITQENERSTEQEREVEDGETRRPPYWKCPLNEFYNPCGNKCERTCKNMIYPDWQCTKICEHGACQCEAGFVRNENGVCVLPTHCPKEEIKCPRNEEVNFCGNLCERKCRHVAEGTITVCPLICNPPACVCKPGYARFHNEGQCVLENHCLVRK